MKSKFLKLSAVAIVVVALLSLGFLSACEDKDDKMLNPKEGVQNIQYSTCKKLDLAKQENIHIDFFEGYLQINHEGLFVPCDFDTIYIKPTFDNNTLSIIEEGNNGYVNCICPIDLKYNLNGVDTNIIKLIIVNEDTVYNNL